MPVAAVSSTNNSKSPGTHVTFGPCVNRLRHVKSHVVVCTVLKYLRKVYDREKALGVDIAVDLYSCGLGSWTMRETIFGSPADSATTASQKISVSSLTCHEYYFAFPWHTINVSDVGMYHDYLSKVVKKKSDGALVSELLYTCLYLSMHDEAVCRPDVDEVFSLILSGGPSTYVSNH